MRKFPVYWVFVWLTEDRAVAEFQDFPNGQIDMYFESWDFSSEWMSNWKHLNSISWKTQWNKLKTLDEDIPFNELYSINMLQVLFTGCLASAWTFLLVNLHPWADGMHTGCVGLCKSVLRLPADVDHTTQVLHRWAVEILTLCLGFLDWSAVRPAVWSRWLVCHVQVHKFSKSA